jgi:hypothetical protein
MPLELTCWRRSAPASIATFVAPGVMTHAWTVRPARCASSTIADELRGMERDEMRLF